MPASSSSRAAAAVLAIASICLAAVVGPASAATDGDAPAALSTLTQTELTASVTGRSVSATAVVSATVAITVQYYKVCVRSGSVGMFDFNPARTNVEITPEGTAWSGVKDLPDGTYTYFSCAELPDGSWWNGPSGQFTVPGPISTTTSTATTSTATTTTATTTVTPPSTTATSTSTAMTTIASTTVTPPSTTVPSTSTATTSTASTTGVSKLLTIVEENHSLAQMQTGMPYLLSLAHQYSYAINYRGITHPSLPNYLAIAGGSTFGVADDNDPAAHVIQGQSIFGQALAAGGTAKVYAESMPGPCTVTGNTDFGYAVKHNPWPYFADERDACSTGDLSTTTLAADVAADQLPTVGMLVPNKCNDAHDCKLAVADSWLRSELAPILTSRDFTTGRLAVVVTSDEDNSYAGSASGNGVLTVVLQASLDGAHEVVTTPLNHYSLSRLYSQVVGATPLHEAASAPDMAAAFGLPIR